MAFFLLDQSELSESGDVGLNPAGYCNSLLPPLGGFVLH